MTAPPRSPKAPRRRARARWPLTLWAAVVGLLVVYGCTFEWPPVSVAQDATADATAHDALPSTDAAPHPDCDANVTECGVCGRSCGDNATCEQGVCVCAPDYLDCDDDPVTNGCEQPRAYGSDDFGYYSTLEDQTAVESPAAGPGATVEGTVTYEPGVVGNGIAIAPAGGINGIEIPNVNVLNAGGGAIRFWYRPSYFHVEAQMAQLVRCDNGLSHFDFLHTDSGALYFLLEGTSNSWISATSADYTWDLDDWVELEVQWRAGDFMRILVNGVTVASLEGDPQIGDGFTPCTTISVGHLTDSREADGVIDELMFFRAMPYTLVGGPCAGTLP